MTFKTELILGGKTATGVVVPEEVVAALGKGKRPAVTVTVNGHSWRSTVAVMGGQSLLPVSAENREASKIAAGDMIEVHVELDEAPRVVEVPEDFAAALAAEPSAQAAFEKLSYSHKRQHTLSIEGAKTAETRQRRIDKAIASLR